YNDAGVIEKFRYLRAAAKIFAPLVGGEAEVFADPAAHVLAVQNDNGAAFVEQASLERVGQGRLTAAGEAGEQKVDGLLAEAGLRFVGRDVAPLAMQAGGCGCVVPVIVTRLGRTAVEDHSRADGAIGQAVDDDERARRAVAAVAIEAERLTRRD